MISSKKNGILYYMNKLVNPALPGVFQIKVISLKNFNQAKNTPVILWTSSIKILSKWVQGFMRNDQTYKQTDRQKEIDFLHAYLFTKKNKYVFLIP